MTTRAASLGLLAVAVGIAVLNLADGLASSAVAVVLLVLGAGTLVATGLLGLRTGDAVKSDAALRAKDEADGAAMKRASETGRWPRVIGGG